MASCSFSIVPAPIWNESNESSKVKASIERALSPSAAKSSIWDYSIQDICALESLLKKFKQEEGKGSERYIALKEAVDALRMAHLPFRSYVRWKEGSFEVNNESFGGSCKSTPKENRTAIKQRLIERASVPEVQQNLKLLSKLTFIHGSNSSALLLMLLSEPILRCTGDLLAEGIGPMCGVFGDGINSYGVNRDRISVETIRNILRIINYAVTNPFQPDKLLHLHRPFTLLPLDLAYHFNQFASDLYSWKMEDPESYWKELAPGMPKTDQLIEAIYFHVETIQNRIGMMIEQTSKDDNDFWYEKGYLKHCRNLMALANALKTGGDFPCRATGNPSTSYRDQIVNPYLLLTKNQSWNKRAAELLQLKQWDEQAFAQNVAPHREKWLEGISLEYAKHEGPLRQILALIDHNFTPEEKAFIRHHSATNSPFSLKSMMTSLFEFFTPDEERVPEGLRTIFPSVSDIPRFYQFSIIHLDSVTQEISLFREEGWRYQWSNILEEVLKKKINETEGLDQFRTHIAKALDIIQHQYHWLVSALMTDAPAVRIPSDATVRSLITHPIPIIFASTTVAASPIGPLMSPEEYLVDHPVPLGRGGIDIIFTDTEESRERLLAILSERLKEEIEIHLFSELEVEGIPLVHAPFQINPTPLLT